ncbi:NACHT domain-containing protein [Streptomyces olivaceus]|uniref:NACHT domain-containing protein n=1 Tax=Streptomyces olivaceus TaxID=47716 RepID=UPI0012FF4CC3|nr:NACHT domain-containing protein [Streptomyces olivaceus]MBZ6106684.1 NACHT domain-containing protein [Streptomyces olivaceus]
MGSVVGSLAGSAVKHGARGVKNRIASRKSVRAAAGTCRVEAIDRVEDLSPAIREKIAHFVCSNEFEQVALQLSVAIAANRKAMVPPLRTALRESLRLYRTVPDETLDLVSIALFEDLQGAIFATLNEVGHAKGFSLVSAKLAAAQASAAVRNSDILSRVEDLYEYDEFCKDFSRQVSLIDSKVRPPQMDAGRRIPIDRIYVQSTLEVEGEEDRLDGSNLAPKDILPNYPRVAVLGDPGGGKSTLASKLCVDLARGRWPGSASKVPFKVIVRDFGVHFKRDKISVVEYIERICSAVYSTPPPKDCVDYLLLNGRAAVIFDGLDELTETSLRQDMVSAVEAFCTAYPSAPIMVTSRKVGYDQAPLDEEIFETLRLGGFSYEQKISYVNKWFQAMRSGSQQEKSRLATDFLDELTHAHELSENPLMLGLMCALYRGAGFIPRNRPELYRRCSEFLFERWDSSRGISVEKPFERGIQFAMFALALQMLKSSDSASGVTEKRLVQFTTQHLHGRHYEDFDAAQDAARSFVKYCRGRAWVLTDVGADAAGNELYAFTHRTFLEYFAARQLVRECGDVDLLTSTLYPKLQNQEWDVVSQLAIQTLDERLLDGSNEAILSLIEMAEGNADAAARRAIASFCARSVEFMDLPPTTLRAIISFYMRCVEVETAEGVHFSFIESAKGLLSCAAEMRHLVVDQVRKIAASSQSESALAFAVTLGQHPSRAITEYWVHEDQKTVEMFLERLETASRKSPWFAAFLYKHGKLDIDSGLSWHGIRFLFDSIDRPPGIPGDQNLFTYFAYRDFRTWVNLAGLSIDTSDKVIPTVLSAPRPWRNRLGSHRWVHDEEEYISDDGDELFLRIVNLILADDFMWEIIGARKKFPQRKRGFFYRNILRAKEGRYPVDRLREDLSILSTAQVDFLVEWVRGEIKLLEQP